MTEYSRDIWYIVTYLLPQILIAFTFLAALLGVALRFIRGSIK